jgi:small subunit ribosomal protein S5
MRFRAIVVVGNRKGKIGIGTGKAAEVQIAVQKAIAQARRRMIRVPIVRGTLPHQIDIKFKRAKIRLMPAVDGTGIIAGGALRPILEHAGYRNVLSKRFGTNNKLVNAQAIMLAFEKLRPARGGTQDAAEEAAAAPTPEAPSAPIQSRTGAPTKRHEEEKSRPTEFIAQ